jgi:radical SAM-linked protein
MLSDPQQSASSPSLGSGSEPVRRKARIRFRKGGDLRFLSHHDLMTCFERMLRRASIPFHSTQGFHPKPRLVFALSLALGIVGCEEAADLELDEDISPAEIRDRLTGQAPPGLEILSVRSIPPRSSAQVRSVTYRLALDVAPATLSGLEERIAALMASPECWVERLRPQKRRVNIRPYLRELRVLPGLLEIDLWVTPTGGARPDEIVGLLGLGDLLAAGAFFERTRMEIADEMIAPGDPIALPDADSSRRGQPAVAGQESPDSQSGLVTPPPRSRLTQSPLTPGPMAYDS